MAPTGNLYKAVLFPGLVNFVPAVAYRFCPNLPAAFSQPGNGPKVKPCTLVYSGGNESQVAPPSCFLTQQSKHREGREEEEESRKWLLDAVARPPLSSPSPGKHSASVSLGKCYGSMLIRADTTEGRSSSQSCKRSVWVVEL